MAETADKEGALQKAEQEIREETPQERLARVKETAIERGYPQGVIELLDKNAETVEFVENYNEKKNSVPAKTIGTDLKAGQIPELIQWDGALGIRALRDQYRGGQRLRPYLSCHGCRRPYRGRFDYPCQCGRLRDEEWICG